MYMSNTVVLFFQMSPLSFQKCQTCHLLQIIKILKLIDATPFLANINNSWNDKFKKNK